MEKCRHYIALFPRIVPLVTNESLCNTLQELGTSNNKGEAFIKSMEKKIGKDKFERGRKEAMKKNLNSLKECYDSSVQDFSNGKGGTMKSSLAKVTDVKSFIERIIKGRKIAIPKVVLGLDGGQSKVG